MIRVFEALQTQVKEVFKKQPNLQYPSQIKFKKKPFPVKHQAFPSLRQTDFCPAVNCSSFILRSAVAVLISTLKNIYYETDYWKNNHG